MILFYGAIISLILWTNLHRFKNKKSLRHVKLKEINHEEGDHVVDQVGGRGGGDQHRRHFHRSIETTVLHQIKVEKQDDVSCSYLGTLTGIRNLYHHYHHGVKTSLELPSTADSSILRSPSCESLAESITDSSLLSSTTESDSEDEDGEESNVNSSSYDLTSDELVDVGGGDEGDGERKERKSALNPFRVGSIRKMRMKCPALETDPILPLTKKRQRKYWNKRRNSRKHHYFSYPSYSSTTDSMNPVTDDITYHL